MQPVAADWWRPAVRGKYELLDFQLVEQRKGGAVRGCTAAIVCALVLGCGLPGPSGQRPLGEVSIQTADSPSPLEDYCAWFGDARDSMLYFGAAAFWSTYRAAGGDPRADLRQTGPQFIGRFDLRRSRFEEPLAVGGPEARSGVWDVLAHPNGRIYFTTYFEPAGYVDPQTGRVRRFEAVGQGLNELALSSSGDILVTRYGMGVGGQGSVVVLDAEGGLRAEYPLEAPEGYQVAPKSLAFDPLREEIWVNTDLLPEAEASGEIRHDTRVLGPDGSERLRFERPEVQFMTFGPDGTGYFAERDGALLNLRIRTPDRAGSAILTGQLVPLDDDFPADLDFVQEIRVDARGDATLTRWGGRIHLVSREGKASAVQLPRPGGDGLYYTAIRQGNRLCATYCGGVTVVCRELEH